MENYIRHVLTQHSRVYRRPLGHIIICLQFSFQGCVSQVLVTFLALLFLIMGYQLGPFELGQIKAHLEHGLKSPAIAKRMVHKTKGKPLHEV